MLCLSALIMVIALAWFSRDAWLAALGRCLTTGDEPRSSAEFAIIPAADYVRSDVGMETLETAVRLQREGRVTRIVMSCSDYYGVSECELAESALRNRGYLGAQFEWLRTEPLPDELEAGKTIQYLKERSAKSAIVLLPNYKVWRLGAVYRRLGLQSSIQVHVSARNQWFNPQQWWRSREGKKRFTEELLRLTRLV